MKKFLFLLLICTLFMNSGCSIKKTDEMSNAEKFAQEYSIEVDNPFEYISFERLKNIFEDGSGIVFFGNSDNEWCLESANVLYDVLVDSEIDTVYYINPAVLNYDEKDELLFLINEEIENIKTMGVTVYTTNDLKEFGIDSTKSFSKGFLYGSVSCLMINLSNSHLCLLPLHYIIYFP